MGKIRLPAFLNSSVAWVTRMVASLKEKNKRSFENVTSFRESCSLLLMKIPSTFAFVHNLVTAIFA
jgi:hypothetical protein